MHHILSINKHTTLTINYIPIMLPSSSYEFPPVPTQKRLLSSLSHESSKSPKSSTSSTSSATQAFSFLHKPTYFPTMTSRIIKTGGKVSIPPPSAPPSVSSVPITLATPSSAPQISPILPSSAVIPKAPSAKAPTTTITPFRPSWTLLREADLHSRIHSPYVAPVIFVTTHSEYFPNPGPSGGSKNYEIVIEIERGSVTLIDIIDEILGTVAKDPTKFKKIALDLLMGLYDIHRKNIIHGDIKLENIVFFGEEDRFKYIDFGLASVNGPIFTQVLSGTWGYIPPEVASGEGKSFASDVWSLGVVFMYLLGGPDVGISREEYVEQNKPMEVAYRERYKAGMDYIRRYFPEYYLIFSTMLDYDPTKRRTVEQLIQDPIFHRFEDWEKAFIKHYPMCPIGEYRYLEYFNLEGYSHNLYAIGRRFLNLYREDANITVFVTSYGWRMYEWVFFCAWDMLNELIGLEYIPEEAYNEEGLADYLLTCMLIVLRWAYGTLSTGLAKGDNIEDYVMPFFMDWEYYREEFYERGEGIIKKLGFRIYRATPYEMIVGYEDVFGKVDSEDLLDFLVKEGLKGFRGEVGDFVRVYLESVWRKKGEEGKEEVGTEGKKEMGMEGKKEKKMPMLLEALKEL